MKTRVTSIYFCVFLHIFSRTLQLHYEIQLLAYVVCLSSVTIVYCDKITEARITKFSLEVA